MGNYDEGSIIRECRAAEPWHETRIRELTQERDRLADRAAETERQRLVYAKAIERLRKAIDTGTAWTADQVVDQAIAMLGAKAEAAAELPLNAKRLARIVSDASASMTTGCCKYGENDRWDRIFEAEGSAVAQAIASALVSDAAVEAAAKARFAAVNGAHDGMRAGIHAALKVALAEPVVTKSEAVDTSHPLPVATATVDTWATGEPRGTVACDATHMRVVLAWLVRRELARTGDTK